MGFLDFIPVVGDVVDGIFGSIDTSATNAANEKIARMNIEQQERTNQWNYKINEETNRWNRDINAATNKSNQQIASAYNANQVQLQNDMNVFNKKMWDLNNQYNSPVQQLQRAAEAGINPNIVFGQPVAASPVQQTSVPSQALAQMSPYYNQSFKADAPRNDMKYQSKGLQALGKALRGLGRLPFVKQELEAKKEEVRSLRLDNEAKEFDKWDREQVKHMFENYKVFRSPEGNTVTPEEYDNLSDSEKRKFQKILGYRNQISDKVLSVEEYNDLPDKQKSLYTPEYGLPEVVSSNFKSQKQYETFKSLYSFGSTMSNIRADQLQNRLREKVLSRQLESNEVTNALSFMPLKNFEMIGYEMKKTIEEIDSLKKHNANLAKRLENQDRMAQYAADKMERDSKRDVIKIIQQYVPEGGMRDFLISAYAIFKDLK